MGISKLKGKFAKLQSIVATKRKRIRAFKRLFV